MTESNSDVSIEALTLPHEDPLENSRLYSEWTTGYPCSSPIERGLIHQAVVALIEKRRLERARATLRRQKVRTAVLFWEQAQEDTVAHYLGQFNLDAPSALVELLRWAAGCKWAIEFWELLARQLQEDGTWYGKYRLWAIQLQGKSARVDELYFSEEAYTTWRDCLACQPNPKQADIDVILDKRNIPKHLQDRDIPQWPRDPAECRARLQALVDHELPRLKALHATLWKHEEPERAEAEVKALASVSKDEMSLLRAERAHEQSYLRATTALLKVRKQPGALRPAPASREIAETVLILRPPVTAPSPPDPTPPAEARPVVGRSEHRSIHADTLTARFPGRRTVAPKTGRRRSHVRSVDRRNRGHEEDPAPEVASDPLEDAPQEAIIPAGDNEKPTEAVATQVVGQPAAYNDPAAAPTSTQDLRPRLNAEDDGAIRAHYRQSVEKTMRLFHECTGTGAAGP